MQIVVIFGFARHIAAFQQQAEFGIHFFRVLQRNFDKLPPQSQQRFIAALQLHDIFARQIGKRRIFVKTHFGGAVELLQIGQLEGRIVFLLFH